MDSTFSRSGRTTHLKIVAVALVAAVVVVVVGINARTGQFATAGSPADGIVLKARQPATYAGQEPTSVR